MNGMINRIKAFFGGHKCEKREIDEAAEECRKAWDAHPEAKWAWCSLHNERLELLEEPSRYVMFRILNMEPKKERVVRLNNFRPVLSSFPKELDEAIEAKFRAAEAYHWINNKRGGPGGTKCTVDELVKARASLDRACRALLLELWTYIESPSCDEAHRRDVPNHTWNGGSIL